MTRRATPNRRSSPPASLSPGGSGRRALLGVLAAGSLLLGACASTPDEPTVYGSAERLARIQPADVAVAPIRRQVGHENVPWDALRASFEGALLERLYSPLDSEYVDGNWVESAFRGTPAPDALLVVAMERWNTDRLYVDGTIEAGAELFLFEGGTTTGALLWGTKVRREIDLRGGRSTPPGPSPKLEPQAARMFARMALESLPARDPLAAHP